MTNAKDSQIFMIEDEADSARNFLKHSEINKLMNEIAYITDFDTLSNFILEESSVNVFWVDINLGHGREEDGIEMIKIARKKCPGALIIVYTAYFELEEKAFAAGADHFFQKGAEYGSVMKDIQGIVKEFLREKGVRIKITEYFAEIAHIEKDWVKVECTYGGHEMTKFFPISPVRACLQEDFMVDAVVKVKVVEKGSEIKVNFEKAYAHAGYSAGEDEERANLLESEIWENKLL